MRPCRARPRRVHPAGVETFAAATSPSGKARVCKTLIAGSIPAVASEVEAIYREIPADRFLCSHDLDASAVRVRNTCAAGMRGRARHGRMVPTVQHVVSVSESGERE